MNPPETLILGIGNVLWADEGFGVRMVELLHHTYQLPDTAGVLDGGTQGLYLLEYVQMAKRLLVFDAIDYGLPPGTLKMVYNEDVPQYMGAKKMSLHQTGFQEVLAAAKLTNHYPEALLLIGVQPALLEDYGGSLTATVKAQMQPALALALDQLNAWGIAVTPRQAPLPADDLTLTPAGLAMHRYEAERPSAEAACRIGDARVLADKKSN